jgi:urea transporter
MNETGGELPYWRQVLRGFSQCAFQTNEVTGALFIAAAAIFNWRMAVFYVVAVLLATLAARLLKGNAALLDLGLYGFNAGLMGLALANFFEPSPALWVALIGLALVTGLVTVVLAKWLPFPFLAAPFILTFWAFWPLADGLGLTKVDFGAFPEANVNHGIAIISALGSALFTPGILSGLVFLAGITYSNWRYALVALFGAFTAVELAAEVSVVGGVGALGGAINSGFAGFNGVLAALAAYSIVAPDLRLVALASVLATWLSSYVYRGAPVPLLASGFVLSIWLILLLGWLNPRFAGSEPAPRLE